MSTAQTAPAPAQKITTFLWFDDQAEEAINFYVSIFKNSRVGDIVRYGDTGPGPKGQVMTADFVLAGQQFTALNGGPNFKFTEAISLVVIARHRKSWMNIGRSCLKVGKKCSAVGLKISSVCRGRLCRRS